MTPEDPASVQNALSRVAQAACRQFGVAPVDERRLNDVLSGSIDPQKLIDGLTEAWRVTPDDARALLESHGFGGILARLRPAEREEGEQDVTGEPFCERRTLALAGGRVKVRAFNPALDEPAKGTPACLSSVARALDAFLPSASKDPLAVLYRHEPAAYAALFMRDDAPRIDGYVREHFGEAGPRYLVNSGIGANEQFNTLAAALANARADRPVTWLMANSPKEIVRLPADATVENVLFMEFSRSGITQETVKLHELTPRGAKRIVFANAGPLQELGKRDGNLVLELPSEVSGRYGRNKTPILMAPMHVAGLDVAAYWETLAAACKAMDLGDRNSPPVALAKYIRLQQLRHGINHIYLGTNDPLLQYSADELCQYWNEGVNRDGNDIMMSRYLGLPRDSHMNLEGVLGTSERKMAIFLLRTGTVGSHGLLGDVVDPLAPEHAGLTPADVDLVLALANVKRCSEKMPTVLITVDEVDLTASAWLGQLWADTTLVYARLIGVDPGSNPEVKAVRTRATQWLAHKAAALALIQGEAPA